MTKLLTNGINRRTLMKGTAAAGLFTLAAPAIVRAQSEVIRLGTLTPLTGAGGPYGPVMAEAAKKVAETVNAKGGILGREITVISEDDQTNPEAGVRAARKLIDVDDVAAIMGTWASSVTTAVAPLCWEGETFLTTVSGADSITELPHHGWLVRTQPNTTLQGRKFGEFCIELDAPKVYFMSPQTPFADSQFSSLKTAVEAGGGSAEILIYDDKKASLRSEVDTALRTNPDMIVMGGYTPDTIVLLKDLYRAGYDGKLLGFGYSVNAKLVEAMPAEAVEGVYTLSPSPAEGSKGYDALTKLIGVEAPDTYTCQVYDHANLVILSMAAGGAATGATVRETIRTVAQGEGEAVSTALDGLAALEAGSAINYTGASGPCDFTEKGDITDAKFRYDQVKDGKITLLKIA
ncbi:ABC transporter substrate-binding protein [Acuticoccus mangrovi]|uniref:ABC transporter substrate-binding protein n=1 Tax=Acuticoccus mangrovi TaxID=2796142 RepID=A0A934MIY2_9HYPH|nr:ABC transporter substrate-binding protein [Acuticoccus mangrovi]MBJ3778360.1 ABC transporter substrate-binding protein [Acuticoccus mangrovi]